MYPVPDYEGSLSPPRAEAGENACRAVNSQVERMGADFVAISTVGFPGCVLKSRTFSLVSLANNLPRLIGFQADRDRGFGFLESCTEAGAPAHFSRFATLILAMDRLLTAQTAAADTDLAALEKADEILSEVRTLVLDVMISCVHFSLSAFSAGRRQGMHNFNTWSVPAHFKEDTPTVHTRTRIQTVRSYSHPLFFNR